MHAVLARLAPAPRTGPLEILADARRDADGTTLAALTAAMGDPARAIAADGTTVYRGTVPARLVAPGRPSPR